MNAEASYVSPRDAAAFVEALLLPHGVPEKDAATIAHCLVLADLRGVVTHGITRLPGYLRRLEKGLINPRPHLSPVRVTAAAALLDGDNGFGFVVGTRAMNAAMDLAREAGVGLVAAKRSTHFGMAACYVLQAAAEGYIALACTNASRAMPPWGGREGLLGTGPIAAAAPGGAGGGYVFDMSPAVVARGRIRDAARHGRQIPLGYALDAEGRPTTDPVAALEGGVVLPVGGPKGSGLAVLVDVLAGVLTGAGFAGSVGDQYHDFSRPQDVGHLFIVIRSDLFLSAAEFRSRLDALTARIRSNPPASGFDEVLSPGDLEARMEQERRRSGIPYHADDIAALNELAVTNGVAPLVICASE